MPPRLYMKIQTIVAIGMCLATVSVEAVEAYMRMENDTFLMNADDDYTHGTSFEIVDEAWHYLLSQTMYAPGDLGRKDHIEGDRPYCGMLLGGVGYEFLNDSKSSWTHYGELDFGMIGPAALCKETQTLIHKWLGCKKPEGWGNQLHNEFVVNGQWWTKYNFRVTDWMYIVPRVGVAAGTVQDMVEVGCDLKVGWNIKPTVNSDIIFSATKGGESWTKKLTAYAYVGVDERYYLYNHVLEGSLFGNKDKGLDVDIERFVGEVRCGAVVKYGRFFATYYAIFREKEFKTQKRSPNYGGIGIGWEF